MTINSATLVHCSRKRETNELAVLRDTLCAEQDRLLITLKEARDKLRDITGWRHDHEVSQVLLALEIVMTISERENFQQMKVERIPVVLRQIENRLQRLGKLLQASQGRAWCHQMAPQCTSLKALQMSDYVM